MIDIRKKIAVWGDSILRGVIFDELRGGYRLLADGCADLFSRAAGLQILNRSRFGCTIDKGAALLEKALAEHLDCDYLLLEYGGNDCDFDWPAVAAAPEQPHQPHTPRPEFDRLLRRLVGQLRQNQIEPVLMSLPPINGQSYLDFLVDKGLDRQALLSFLGDPQQIYRYQESYSLAITGVALQERTLYVPIREAFLAQFDSPALLCADGIHPNEAGHRLMGQVFLQTASALALAAASR
jgi:acyl-CoA thioesterase I